MEVHGGPAKRKRRNSPNPEWLELMSASDREYRRIEQWKPVPLADVGLPVRITNMLEHNGIFTVGDLTRVTSRYLMQLPNLGMITINHCAALLSDLNIPNRLNQ